MNSRMGKLLIRDLKYIQECAEEIEYYREEIQVLLKKAKIL